MMIPSRTILLPVLLLLLGGCVSAPSPPVRDTLVVFPKRSYQPRAAVVPVTEGNAAVERPSAAAPAGAGSAAAGRASEAATVTTSGGTAILDEPPGTAEVTAGGGISTGKMRESETNQRFGSVPAAQPPRPISRTLYFVEGTDRLTPESVPVLSEVKAVIATWPRPRMSVIGHTDRVGSQGANDKLGMQRAEMVKRALVGSGIDAGTIDVASRGEREPAVPTGDEVPEPRNRRVEINVR